MSIEEATRQLVVCNACRYCEGLCAVFPALERRRELGAGDIVHLANLCHDCRACLYACPYSPPHEFAVNPPRALAEVRRQSWDDLVVWPYSALRRFGGSVGVVALLVTVAIVLLAGATEGLAALTRAPGGPSSPYRVITYRALVTVAAAPLALAVAAMTGSSVRFWRTTHGRLGELFRPRALARAVLYAGSLRYLRGGGEECDYPDDRPSPVRRHLHGALAYGFGLCVVSTISAAVLQDLASTPPPYGLVSFPVLTGLVGGAGIVLGSGGLIVLKRRNDPLPTDAEMAMRDYGLLMGLFVIGATGVATFLLRTSAAFGIVLVVHLVAVVTAFALVPTTKFVHVLYRFFAIVNDNLEHDAATPVSPRRRWAGAAPGDAVRSRGRSRRR